MVYDVFTCGLSTRYAHLYTYIPIDTCQFCRDNLQDNGARSGPDIFESMMHMVPHSRI